MRPLHNLDWPLRHLYLCCKASWTNCVNLSWLSTYVLASPLILPIFTWRLKQGLKNKRTLLNKIDFLWQQTYLCMKIPPSAKTWREWLWIPKSMDLEGSDCESQNLCQRHDHHLYVATKSKIGSLMWVLAKLLWLHQHKLAILSQTTLVNAKRVLQVTRYSMMERHPLLIVEWVQC